MQELPSQHEDLPARLVADWPLAAWDGVHVLAAVSGGADSVALVCALLAAKRAGSGAGLVFVGHVNHRLRGAASDADEAWLRDQCQHWGAPLLVRHGTPPPASSGLLGGTSPSGIAFSEEAARSERYHLLQQMAAEVGARFIATAHTRDDQVETVLFRAVRGSGLRGLAGMRRVRALSHGVTLVRPLLEASRAELRSWLTAQGQTWREDATNADLHFARNRIRAELLPYLREHFNASADEAILRLAQQAGEAQSVMEALAADLLSQCSSEFTPDRIALDAAPLVEQPPALAAEALRLAWRTAGWPEQALTHEWWRRLAGLAQAAAPAPGLNLPGNVLARRASSQLVLDRKRAAT